jgi:MFS family permease
VIGFVVEPTLFLLADRWPRKWFIRGGVAGMAIASFAAAFAPSPLVLALALAVHGVAGGLALGIAQATLVDRYAGARPNARARTMARWTLISVFGDLAAPAILAALAFIGFGWRASFLVVGVAMFAWLVALCATELDVSPEVDDGEPKQSVFAAFKDALGDKTLVAWLFGAVLCNLLDEILVVFASLHLRIDLGASLYEQGATIAAFTIGEAVSLVVLDKLLVARSERSLLVVAGIGCAITYSLWLAAPAPLAAILLAAPAGVFIAPLYPLTAAQAYAQRPGKSGSVQAVGHLFSPISLALPWLLGIVADRASIVTALALLVIQPIGLVALVAVTCRRGR